MPLARTVGLVLLLVVYAGITARAVRVWRSELALWAHALTVSPTSERALSNYAKARVAAGDWAWLPR